MKDSRRDFLRKAAVTAAPVTALSGCIGDEEDQEIDSLYIETDLEELDTEVGGHDVYVNIMTYAEDEKLEEMALQYREPGEEAWNLLESQEASDNEAQISEPFHTETEGEYEFRSVASTETTQYISETEEVVFR
ncbi:MAG: hypothetical protein ABEK10_04440 [Candidatus Nanosalina sp.]